WIVHVWVRGNGIAESTPNVLTRANLDPKVFNEAALAQVPAELHIKGQQPLLYGPESTLVLEAGRVVEGEVTDLTTGKPLAGVSVGTIFGFGNSVTAVTGADGKYRLAGLPQEKNYQVSARPTKGSTYLARSAAVEADPGTGSVRIDVELTKGVVVT